MTRAILDIALPICRNCGRHWRPQEGVVSTNAYCNQCRSDRRVAAAVQFSFRPIALGDLEGPYLLPLRLRGRQAAK